MIHNLCDVCVFRRVIISDKGSQFMLCEKSKADPRYPKYPRLPVVECDGFAPEGLQDEEV